MLEGAGFAWVMLAAITVGLVIGVVAWSFLRNVKRPAPTADPLVEAGFYYSYGQKKRAIQILELAQQTNPQRQDIAKQLSEWRNE
jgi:hypothetical protein